MEQSGAGTLYAFTVAWHPHARRERLRAVHPGGREQPGTGGVRIIGNLVDVRPSEVAIGMKVHLLARHPRRRQRADVLPG